MKLSNTLLKTFSTPFFRALVPGLVGMTLLMIENLLLLHMMAGFESDIQPSQEVQQHPSDFSDRFMTS